MENARGKKSRSNFSSKTFIALVIMASMIPIGLFYFYNPKDQFEIRENWISTKSKYSLDEAQECGYLYRQSWSGRLGNVMFQYASFYGMFNDYRRNRSDHRKKLVLASSMPSELRDAFEGLSLFRSKDIETRQIPTDSPDTEHLDENDWCRFEPIDWSKLKCDNVSFETGGYRQSFKYFENVREEIRREFLLNFRKSVRDKCDQRFENISIDHPHCSIVGVHLRRGDLASHEKQHSAATERYFQATVRFFEETFRTNLSRVDPKLKCQLFLIFGDDYEWNLRVSKNVTLLYRNATRLELIDWSKSSAAIDICLMTKCDHVAMSVGSFGWWGGYLGRGIVTYEKKNRKHNLNCDYFLPNWIPL